MQVLPAGQTNDIEVLWDDQKRINEFSKLNSRLADLEEEIKGLETEKEYVDDAMMELELVDEEDKVQYKIGDSFVFLLQPAALERLQSDSEKIDSKLEKLRGNVSGVNESMEELKKHLYAKFGSAINLER